jgi:hypothetical protein
VCAGVPLTAIGIATSHAVEVVSAVTLAAGMLVAASIFALVATRRAWPISKAAAVLFGAAGAALLTTMALATTFATTSSAGRGSSLEGAIPIQTMIDVHGGGNAFGFALSALVALTLLSISTPRSPPARSSSSTPRSPPARSSITPRRTR